jgi:hypothetical protein
MTKRENLFVSLFNSLLFGVVFTFVGPVLSGQSIIWGDIPAQIIVGVVIGLAVSLIIPAGAWGGMLAAKVSKPGSILFKFVMYSVILVTMLTFMCPILTVFIACVQGGAPLMAVLPGAYSMAPAFYAVGIVLLLLVGDAVTGFAIRCSHMGGK